MAIGEIDHSGVDKNQGKGQTVLVTGVAGFLGSHLADRFLAAGYRVKGCDNLIGGYMDNVPDGVEFEKIDLCDFEVVRDFCKDVDLVYHTAATAYEGLSVFSPRLISKHIFDASVSIISAAVANNVKRFIYCTSMARYGSQEVPFTEEMSTKPQDPYGIAKVGGENMLKNLAEVHGMEYIIAVPHNIIGPRQKYDDPYRNVASIMINRMLQGKQPIIYGDGEQMRCFSFVQDDVDPLFRLATADCSGEVVNIGPDEEFVTINELAKIIAKLLDFDLDPIYMPGRPQEVKKATCSAGKARKLISYKTSTTLEEGLQSTIDYIKERGPKPFEYHFDLEIVTDKTPRTWKDRLM